MKQKIYNLLAHFPSGRLFIIIKSTAFIYGLLTISSTLLLIWRFPNMISHPNFYAEDGSVFLQNILDKGVLSSLFASFNGYFVTGLYLLGDVAIGIHTLLGSDFLSLPIFFTLVSIFFLAAVICLPYALFSTLFGRVQMLTVVLLSVLMPLPQTPFTVIGIVGNQKFTFFYLAFLLVLYRLITWKNINLKKSIIIDVVLLLCTYTNSSVYFLLPLLVIPYVLLFATYLKKQTFRNSLKKICKNKSLLSLFALYVLVIPQIIYVLIHGIPELKGYLDTPYQGSRTIEIFGNRTFIYGITHSINQYMGDLRTLVIIFWLVVAGWFLLKGKEKLAFFLGLYAAAIASLLFVINRPGISDFFFGYNKNGSGPDQFFFAQTLIMYIPLVLIVFGLPKLVKSQKIGGILVASICLLLILGNVLSIQKHDIAWKNAGVYENSGITLSDQAIQACQGKQNRLSLFAYTPSGTSSGFTIQVPRSEVCNKTLLNQQVSYEALGLVPFDNNFLAITKSAQVRQTFTAHQNNLNGVKLFLSNFDHPFRETQYSFILYANDCKTVVRQVPLPKTTWDNSYYRINFKNINNSKNGTYCFGLTPPKKSGYEKLAVQLSKPDLYSDKLLIDGHPVNQDLVFELLYSPQKK